MCPTETLTHLLKMNYHASFPAIFNSAVVQLTACPITQTTLSSRQFLVRNLECEIGLLSVFDG